MMKYTITSILLGSLLSIGSASAANVIVNGSFENTSVAITPDTVGAAWGDEAAAGGLSTWSVSSTTVNALANGGNGTPSFYIGNGSTASFLNADDGQTFYVTYNGGNTTLSQAITGLGAGNISVSFSLAAVTTAGDGGGAMNAQVLVYDGANDSADLIYDSTSLDARLGPDDAWDDHTSSAFANTGSDVFVKVILTNNSGGGANLAFDNLVVDYTAVPEPSSAALLGLGGVVLILRRRK